MYYNTSVVAAVIITIMIVNIINNPSTLRQIPPQDLILAEEGQQDMAKAGMIQMIPMLYLCYTYVIVSPDNNWLVVWNMAYLNVSIYWE